MKFLTSIWIVLITVMVGVGLRVYDVEPLKILRLKTFDYYQKIQPRTVTSNHFVVVEITEQDLKQYGQWPWNRNLIAQIHQRIINQKDQNANVAQNWSLKGIALPLLKKKIPTILIVILSLFLTLTYVFQFTTSFLRRFLFWFSFFLFF